MVTFLPSVLRPTPSHGEEAPGSSSGLGEVRGQVQVYTKDQVLMSRVVQPQGRTRLSYGRRGAERIQASVRQEGGEAAF